MKKFWLEISKNVLREGFFVPLFEVFCAPFFYVWVVCFLFEGFYEFFAFVYGFDFRCFVVEPSLNEIFHLLGFLDDEACVVYGVV